MNQIVKYNGGGFINNNRPHIKHEIILPLRVSQPQPQPLMYYRHHHHHHHFHQQQPQQQVFDFNINRYMIEESVERKRYKHNKELLYYLNIGDVLQYHIEEDNILYETDIHWALYIGNGQLVLLTTNSNTSTIQILPFWSIANKYFIHINNDLEKNYYKLSPHVAVQRALYAFNNRSRMSINFSSDKNFVLWCKFDINKSDLEFSTNINKLSIDTIKLMTIQKFLNSIDLNNNKDCSSCKTTSISKTPSLSSS